MNLGRSERPWTDARTNSHKKNGTAVTVPCCGPDHTKFWRVDPSQILRGGLSNLLEEGKACTGILFNHESPLRPPRFVTRKIIQGAVKIHRGETASLMLGNLDIQRDWGYAPEYVEAMWQMLQQPKPIDYVVATGESHSLKEFVRETFRKLGINYKNFVVSDKNLNRPSEIQISVADARKAKRDLKWEARVKFDELVSLLIENAKL